VPPEEVEQRSAKRERREARKREALTRRRRRRLVRLAIAAAILVVPALWGVEMSGDEEVVQAEVLRTRLWRHRPASGRPHVHSEATLIIEGLNEVSVPQADGLERGSRVDVWIRRGRLSEWPYFVELASQREGGAAPEALEEGVAAEAPAESEPAEGSPLPEPPEGSPSPEPPEGPEARADEAPVEP
jgi:hypothetical protein